MVSEFSLTSEIRDNCLIIYTKGYINNQGGERILTEFSKHTQNGMNRVIFDLAGSKVVNSIGISFLIEIIEKLNETGGKAVFANLDPAIEKTFTIMGIFQFAEKAKDVREGLGKLK